MITSSGVRCDVCGDLIVFDMYKTFSVKGIKRDLHCHASTCVATVQAAGKDWHKLPAGPLREAFEKAELTTEEATDGQV